MTERVDESDIAYRLIHPNLWVNDLARPMSSIFRDRAASVFLRSLLPAPADDILHTGSFAKFGRLALRVGEIRRLTDSGGSPLGLDVVLDPDGTMPPFEALRDAHAVLLGAHPARASRALLEFVLANRGCIERLPS